MAKKAKTSRTKKKTTPAVRYLRYEVTNSGTPGNETSHYIDLARDLSAINRRLYRQGRAYHVRKITVISTNTPTGDNRISVSTVPDSWVARNAWKRGFQMWQKMRKQATDKSGIKPGTWNDFKVHLTDDSRTAGGYKTPKDNGGNDLLYNEWNYATLHTPDGTTSADAFELHMLGDHNGSAGSLVSVGLVKSYGQSRTTVQGFDPETPPQASDDPLVNMFDDGTAFDEIINSIEDENDNPPYNLLSYPGSAANHPKPIVVQDAAIVDGRATLGGFTAICGLLELETKSSIPSDVYSVLVELAPGNYRGIGAEVI